VNRPPSLEAAMEEKLFTEEQIKAKVQELAARLVSDYRGKQPLVVGILNGCVPFLSDLIRAMDEPLEVDFISCSSYGGSTKSSGVVRLLKDLEQGIEGRHVLLVEDIIDTGLTLKYLVENLQTRKPATIEICTLLDKAEARTESVAVKYTGFACPNRFVVGYGLDYAGLYRNLPYIGVLKPEIYK
jgi:hypoxanthine phosphoribosyltransferase